MGIYRKKPVVVEAHRFTGSSTSVGQMRRWMQTGIFHPSGVETRDCFRTFEILTPEGTMSAVAGDMIIKGVAGEFYPCKPDIFSATYEEVSDDE